jgi:hypothetical protein
MTSVTGDFRVVAAKRGSDGGWFRIVAAIIGYRLL